MIYCSVPGIEYRYPIYYLLVSTQFSSARRAVLQSHRAAMRQNIDDMIIAEELLRHVGGKHAAVHGLHNIRFPKHDKIKAMVSALMRDVPSELRLTASIASIFPLRAMASIA